MNPSREAVRQANNLAHALGVYPRSRKEKEEVANHPAVIEGRRILMAALPKAATVIAHHLSETFDIKLARAIARPLRRRDKDGRRLWGFDSMALNLIRLGYSGTVELAIVLQTLGARDRRRVLKRRAKVEGKRQHQLQNPRGNRGQ